MSQQSQGTYSSPIDLPMKRKRGRPRKFQNLVQDENLTGVMMPGPDSSRKNKVSADTSEKMDDAMVGQVVSGVIDGSFDAGYLLNVKVGNTDTQLRGVVFLPGRFVPVTTANDIAPHVTMLQRKEIPVPACNMQTPPPGSTSQSKQSISSPLEPRNLAPVSPGQTPSGNQVASVMAPPADSLPRNGACPSLVGKPTPQVTSESSATVLLADNMAKNNSGPSMEGIFVPKQASEPGFEIPPSVSEQPVEIMNQGIFPDRDPRFEIHHAAPMELDNQPASAILSLAVNSANYDIGSSLEENSLPQQTSESQVIEINSNASILPEQASFIGLQLGTHATLDKQPRPSSDVVPLAGNLPQTVSYPSWGGKHVLQQTSGSGLEIHLLHQGSKQQSIQQVTPFDLQSSFPTALDIESGPSLEAEAIPQQSLLSGLGDRSAPFMAQMKFDEVIEQEELLGDFNLNALVHEEVREPNIELPTEEPGTGNDLVLRIGCEAQGSQNLR